MLFVEDLLRAPRFSLLTVANVTIYKLDYKKINKLNVCVCVCVIFLFFIIIIFFLCWPMLLYLKLIILV